MIKRYSAPTHLDVLPYLEEWHHELEDGSVQIWVQCNEIIDDTTKPRWVRLGDLYEAAVLSGLRDVSKSSMIKEYVK